MKFLNKVAIEDLLKIDQESFSDHDAWDQSTFQRFLNNQDVQLIAAQLDNQIAGYLLVFKMIDVLEILSVAVQINYRRQKIASQLIEKMIEQNPDCQQIFLEVRASNQAAIAAYRENQFKIIHQRVNYYSQPNEDALIMERKIG